MSPLHSRGQLPWTIESNDAKTEESWKNKSFVQRSSADSVINNVYNDLLVQGYLDAKLDTISVGNVIHCTIVKGKVYSFGKTRWIGDSLMNHRLSTQTDLKPGTALDNRSLEISVHKRLNYLENNGYPFASVSLVAMDLINDSLNSSWKIIAGPRILMDSIIIKSESKIPRHYIRNYIDIRQNSVYDESRLNQLQKKLSEIPFISVAAPPQVEFNKDKATLYVTLQRKKANYFNGVLGIQPNDKTGKISFTGDLEIKLLNAFNSGEEIFLNWRRLQLQTQELRAKVSLPFLFNTPFGTEGDIKIYRRDSTFSSVKTAFGLLFSLGGQNKLRAFVEKNQSTQLSALVSNASLANVNSTLYGLSALLEKLDYRLNPRRGWSASLEGAAGKRAVSSKQISENQPQTNDRSLYRLQGKMELYIPTFARQCIRIGETGALYSTTPIYSNEMYRIGGLNTIRGIDEESIFASAFSTTSIEYRYLLDQNSAVYLFADQNWYENKNELSSIRDTPLGFGAGLNLDTNAGIFTFNYALAQQFDNPILVRNAKISFGFRNIF